MRSTSERPLSPPGNIFWQKLKAAPGKVLLLDYDGTLAPFQVQRDKAVPYPGVRKALDRIISLESCRTVLISGRWTRDLPALLGLEKLPEIWGSHGIERLTPDGGYEVATLPEEQVRGLAEADDRVKAAGLEEYSEHKPGCLALHWRGLDPITRGALINRVEDELRPLTEETGLILKEFDGGLELRTPGRTKGDAVRTILAEEGADTVCAYLGDDLTDEDAFKALDDNGLGVLVRENWRPTAASAWLRPPEELVAFLKNWADACA